MLKMYMLNKATDVVQKEVGRFFGIIKHNCLFYKSLHIYNVLFIFFSQYYFKMLSDL